MQMVLVINKAMEVRSDRFHRAFGHRGHYIVAFANRALKTPDTHFPTGGHLSLPIAAALTSLLLLSNGAFAGPYTDDLSRCLVASTTQADRVALARWMVIAFSAHPSVAPLSAVKPADIEIANAEIGDLFMKLLTDSCREKTKVALKFEGPAAIQLSFQVLGQVAGAELASNPSVQARMTGAAKHIDVAKLKELTAEPEANTAK